MITAAEALRATEDSGKTKLQRFLQSIEKDITLAAADGHYSISVDRYISESSDEGAALRKLGFKVKPFYDHRDGDWTVISW